MNPKKGTRAVMERKDQQVIKPQDWAEKVRKKEKWGAILNYKVGRVKYTGQEKDKEIEAIFARQSINIVINRSSSENPIQQFS